MQNQSINMHFLVSEIPDKICWSVATKWPNQMSFDLHQLLTLNTPTGATMCPPCHIFVYNRANTRTSVLKKLDFSQLWVWKRAVRFSPHEIISFRRKKKTSSEIPKFHKAGPLQTGSNASQPSQTLFWRVVGIQTSWILLNMVNHS